MSLSTSAGCACFRRASPFAESRTIEVRCHPHHRGTIEVLFAFQRLDDGGQQLGRALEGRRAHELHHFRSCRCGGFFAQVVEFRFSHPPHDVALDVAFRRVHCAATPVTSAL
jgi:hypothetical protein